MSVTIWGQLNLTDAQTLVNQVGQVQTFQAIQTFIERHNAAVQAAISTLVAETTTDIETFFETPGGGMMQEANEMTRPGAIKTRGRYNVGYPLRDARDQIAGDDITLAYMTLQQLNRTIQTIFIRHLNWVRFNMLKAIFNNVNDTAYMEEQYNRTIVIRRLANNDGTIYAPTISAETGAQDDHYLVSGYIASAISNTNNPFPVLRDEIKEHFGESVNIVAFINPNQRAVVEALADFVGYGDPNIRRPNDTEVIVGSAPRVMGTIIGRVSGVWVSEWISVPDGYIYAQDVAQPGPLTKRVDTPTDIAGRGQLALVARQVEFPLQESFWRDRHGYGVSNRLSAAVMQLAAPGAYAIPALYA